MKEKLRRDDQERLLLTKRKIKILEAIAGLIAICCFIAILIVAFKLEDIISKKFELDIMMVIVIKFLMSIFMLSLCAIFLEKVFNKNIQRLQTEYDEIVLSIKEKELFDNDSEIFLKDDSEIKKTVLNMLYENMDMRLSENQGTYEILVTAKIDETFQFHLKDLYEVLENVGINN